MYNDIDLETTDFGMIGTDFEKEHKVKKVKLDRQNVKFSNCLKWWILD